MLFYLLAEEGANANTNANATGMPPYVSYILIGVLLVLFIGAMFFMNRRNKKREKEAQDLINAVKPGNKVKTIGGVMGIVVEVDPEDDTFVLETGSENSGKSYIKFMRQAIYESDAVVEKSEDGKKSEEKTEEAAEEQPAEENTSEKEEN